MQLLNEFSDREVGSMFDSNRCSGDLIARLEASVFVMPCSELPLREVCDTKLISATSAELDHLSDLPIVTLSCQVATEEVPVLDPVPGPGQGGDHAV